MERLCQSPADPAFVQDPYPFYDRARRAGPLVYWDDYGMVAATTYEAVNTILRDRRFGREIPAEQRAAPPERLAPFYAIEANSMLELEPPRHTRLRGLVLRAFTNRSIAALAPGIADLCHQLIDQFPSAPFDLLPAFAQRVPVVAIARLLGVPEAKADDLLAWSNAMVAMYQARRTEAIEARAVTATTAFRTWIEELIAVRRRSPGDDLLTRLIAAEAEGARLSHGELISTVILLLNAGHEATVHTLGNGVKALLETGHRVTDANAAETVAEILRYDPPLHLFTRYAYEEAELFGHRFARGAQIACLLGSAGRDSAIYDAPDLFEPGRPGPAALAFGAGIHFCVGAPLARVELEIALPMLFARCPGLRLVETPTYANLYHFHGLERLMVTT